MGGPHVPKFMCVGQRSPMLKSRLFISTLLRWSLLSLCCVIQTSWPESFQAILLSLGICLPSHCEVLRLQMNATTSAFPMGSKNWAGIARFVQQALSPTELWFLILQTILVVNNSVLCNRSSYSKIQAEFHKIKVNHPQHLQFLLSRREKLRLAFRKKSHLTPH